MFNWICALELDQDRQIIAGSEKALSDAVRRGLIYELELLFVIMSILILIQPILNWCERLWIFVSCIYLKITGWPEFRICVCLCHSEKDSVRENRCPSFYIIRMDTKRLPVRILTVEFPQGQLGRHQQMIIGVCPSTMN